MAMPPHLRSVRFTPGTPLEDLPDDLELTTAEAAPYCDAKPNTLNRWRPHRGPAFVQYGDGKKPRVFYRVADLRAWLTAGYRRRIDPSEGTETPARCA